MWLIIDHTSNYKSYCLIYNWYARILDPPNPTHSLMAWIKANRQAEKSSKQNSLLYSSGEIFNFEGTNTDDL